MVRVRGRRHRIVQARRVAHISQGMYKGIAHAVVGGSRAPLRGAAALYKASPTSEHTHQLFLVAQGALGIPIHHAAGRREKGRASITGGLLVDYEGVRVVDARCHITIIIPHGVRTEAATTEYHPAPPWPCC